MRTTWEIQDDALDEVKEYAAARSISNGMAATILLRRALAQPPPVRLDGHFFVFSPPEGGTISLEHALRIDDESE